MTTENLLRGEQVELRARRDDDIAVLHHELYDDIATRVRADSRPWIPLAVDAGASPYAVGEPMPEVAFFSIVESASGDLAGEALVWGIDTHNRSGHLGLSLRPSFRGRGLGTDTVAVLCRYGFGIRGLHRLQLETLADNAAMIRAAAQNGFEHEGTLRQSAWVDGGFADEVIFARLAS